MRTISFNVTQQRIKNKDSICFVYGGTDNYLKLKFNFNEDWTDCIKAISFVPKDKKELPMLLENDSCIVPKTAFDDTNLTFYIVGKKKDYRIQTQDFVIKLGG